MAEYKETHGGKVKNYESDPDNPYVGQLWYNEELGSLRIYATTNSTAWSIGGNLNTGRYGTYGAGIQTAALCFGGDLGPSTVNNESLTVSVPIATLSAPESTKNACVSLSDSIRKSADATPASLTTTPLENIEKISTLLALILKPSSFCNSM